MNGTSLTSFVIALPLNVALAVNATACLSSREADKTPPHRFKTGTDQHKANIRVGVASESALGTKMKASLIVIPKELRLMIYDYLIVGDDGVIGELGPTTIVWTRDIDATALFVRGVCK